MFPGAPCLQSLEFMQRSQTRSGKRSFVPPEVFEWLWRRLQQRGVIIELRLLARMPLFGGLPDLLYQLKC